MGLTSDEIKVVIAAVIVYIVLNIIMWSVIAAVNRKHNRQKPPLPPITLPISDSGERVLLIQPEEDLDSRAAEKYSDQNLPSQHPLIDAKPDESFRITQSTVITHSDERI